MSYGTFVLFVDKAPTLNVLYLLLARLIGQYCFARCRLLRRQARWRTVAAGPGAWPGRLPTHGGPVWLRPVRSTPCYIYYNAIWHHIAQILSKSLNDRPVPEPRSQFHDRRTPGSTKGTGRDPPTVLKSLKTAGDSSCRHMH